MWRQTIEQAEEEKKRHTTVIEQYKKVGMSPKETSFRCVHGHRMTSQFMFYTRSVL